MWCLKKFYEDCKGYQFWNTDVAKLGLKTYVHLDNLDLLDRIQKFKCGEIHWKTCLSGREIETNKHKKD